MSRRPSPARTPAGAPAPAWRAGLAWSLAGRLALAAAALLGGWPANAASGDGPRRAAAALAVPAAPASATPGAGSRSADAASPATSLRDRLDPLLRLGDDWPDRALTGLAAISTPADAADRRQLALARAVVAARSSDAAVLAAHRSTALAAASAIDAALAEADSRYLAALRAERDGTAGVELLASDALARYDAHCQAHPAPEGTQPCEAATRWQLHDQLARRASNRLDEDSGRDHARTGLALARLGDDLWRQTISVCQLARFAARSGNPALAQQELARAQALAHRTGDDGLLARVYTTQSELAVLAGDVAGAVAPLRRARQLATAAQTERQLATVLSNLADLAMRQHPPQPRAALQDAEAGLAITRRLGMQRLARVLLHNAMLAKVALGQTAAALRDHEQLQQAWAAEANTGMQVGSLREMADALADAGDAANALALHHREQALSTSLSRDNQARALAELRKRNDHEAQQRDIRLLASDNAVKSAELTRQGLARRLWLLGGGAVALALGLTALLLRRVRHTNRLLEHNRLRLRLQNERDALTGLANRRHLQALLQTAQQEGDGLQGALLMLDIDHFKQINDGHGHAAGDAVLVAVAQRIAASVREADTVARWGGEEFLILAPRLGPDEVQALAQRLLQAIGGSPVVLPGGAALAVTASIGHAVFPLLPHRVPLRAEQAINLVDMALYRAKRQGRHRAVGIRSAAAADAAGLQALEADFERGWAEGRVALLETPGPASAPVAPPPGMPEAARPVHAAH